MKRIAIFGVLLPLLVLGAAILLIQWLVISPARPRYEPAKKRIVAGSYDWINYDYLSPSPFQGGKVWVEAMSKKQVHVYPFDIEKREILGELFNAWPELMNGDQTRVLCTIRTPAPTNVVSKVAAQIVGSLSVLRNYFSLSDKDRESLWTVDLKRNSARPLGKVYQWNGAGSSLWPSPDFSHAFDKPTGSFNTPDFFIANLDKNTFRRERVDGWPCGWWDNERILWKATNNDFVLCDIVSWKLSALVSQQQLATFLRQAGLTNAASSAHPFFTWNGKENEFYLTDGNSRWSAVKSYLIRIERSDGKLKLMDPKFKFEWSDHFDAIEKHYLYSGRDRGNRTSGVYLRDLATGNMRELVPENATHTNDFSMPQFYGDKVIYEHDKALWIIAADGSGNQRLFPSE